jgi:predicted ATP-binding protein involved in virulence
MLEFLRLEDVGPAPALELNLARRVNIITGDNGLGKSFLLDAAWWALTRTWSSLPIRPLSGAAQPSISFRFQGKANSVEYKSVFHKKDQSWTGKSKRSPNPGLVLYAQADGGFSVWDPARNYWRSKGDLDVQDRPPAYQFSSTEIWDGLEESGKHLCNGLIRDWASWQKEKGTSFDRLKAILENLSPSPDEKLTPGNLTRISLDDVRDIPTLQTSYGQEVPVLHASAGVKRIISLGYLLVWAWEEHQKASQILDQEAARQIIFLIDEIEAHLHPRWQRTILASILNIMAVLSAQKEVGTQLICATHSPLLLASVEPFFDETTDKLFHLETKENNAFLEEIPWSKQGDASNWLVSDVFGLRQARSWEAEQAIEAAEAFMRSESEQLPAHLKTREAIHRELQRVLAGHDPFWPRWIVHWMPVKAHDSR